MDDPTAIGSRDPAPREKTRLQILPGLLAAQLTPTTLAVAARSWRE